MKRKQDPERDEETARLDPGAAPGTAEERLPPSIGEYRIVRKLGEGGMGVVYEAEQPSLHRRVAVKVIRGGATAGEESLRMFIREAETLGRLQHPAIGAIHEAGRTADGQPFLVMEKVEGVPLDAFLRARGRPLDREEIDFRLRLFLDLCAAVAYAHQRGVIHRDLKPQNVLAAGTPDAGGCRIKVLDFGLARIVAAGAQEPTAMTAVGTIKGTLSYMSPEQARGTPEAIDVRTDVYALGVILFEMLTGELPLKLRGRELVEALEAIRAEPPRRLAQAWPGPRRPDEDLETIAGKALEKDVERRYAGVAALADDVQRYLGAQPILARPPSHLYLLRKFASRNKALTGGVVATLTMLVAGAAVSTTFGLREARQRREAEAARDDLQAVVEFQADMIGEVDPERAGRQILSALTERVAGHLPEEEAAARRADLERAVRDLNPTDLARDVLDQNILRPAAEAAGAEFASRPEIEARLQQTIGETYRALGLLDEALGPAGRAVELARREQGRAAPGALAAEEALAELRWERKEYEAAAGTYREIEQALAARLGAEHPEVLRVAALRAAVEWARGNAADAVSLYERTLEAYGRVAGTENATAAEMRNNLAVIHFREGRFEPARVLWEQALETRRRLLGAENADTLDTLTNLAWLHREQGELDRAAALFDEALGIQRRTLGDDHPQTLRTQGSLASLHTEAGRRGEAIALHRRTLDSRVRTLGPRNPETLRSINNLAVALTADGQHAEARELLDVLVALDREVHPGSRDEAVHLHSLGELHLATGDLPQAGRALGEALAIYRKIGHRYAGLASYQLAGIAARQGRRDDAIEHLRRARELGHERCDPAAPELASLVGDPEFAGLCGG